MTLDSTILESSIQDTNFFTGFNSESELFKYFERVRAKAQNSNDILSKNYHPERIYSDDNIALSVGIKKTVPYFISTICQRSIFPSGYARVVSRLWKLPQDRRVSGFNITIGDDVFMVLSQQIEWLKINRPDIRCAFVSWESSRFSANICKWWKIEMLKKHNSVWEIGNGTIVTCDSGQANCKQFYCYINLLP